MFRSYMNPTTRNWVFMEYNTDYGRWFPHAPTMRAWCDGAIRVYRPADNPAKLITMSTAGGHYDASRGSMSGGRQWPAMSPTECCYISTADVPASWVSNAGIIDCIDEADIEGYDAWSNMYAATTDYVPQLVPLSNLAGVLLAQIQRDGPALVTLFEPIHQPLEPIHQPQEVSSCQHSSAAPAAANTTANALPPHVVSLLIKEAIGTQCPITMEPITKDTADVTSCGHVFNRDGLQHWYATGHNTCPQCRSVANVTGK